MALIYATVTTSLLGHMLFTELAFLAYFLMQLLCALIQSVRLVYKSFPCILLELLPDFLPCSLTFF